MSSGAHPKSSGATFSPVPNIIKGRRTTSKHPLKSRLKGPKEEGTARDRLPSAWWGQCEVSCCNLTYTIDELAAGAVAPVKIIEVLEAEASEAEFG